MKPIHILLATAALVAAPTLANADSAAVSGSNSGASSLAAAGVYGSGNSRNSLSSSNRNALSSTNRNATTVIDNNTLGAYALGGGGNNGGGGGSIIHNTPDVGVASYAGAANNCGVGGGGSFAGPGAGLGITIALDGDTCRKESLFAALRVASENMYKVNPVVSQMYDQAARALLCQVGDVARANVPGFCALAPTQVVAVPPPVAYQPPPVQYQPTQAAYQPPQSPTQGCEVWQEYANYYRDHNITLTLGHPECGAP